MGTYPKGEEEWIKYLTGLVEVTNTVDYLRCKKNYNFTSKRIFNVDIYSCDPINWIITLGIKICFLFFKGTCVRYITGICKDETWSAITAQMFSNNSSSKDSEISDNFIQIYIPDKLQKRLESIALPLSTVPQIHPPLLYLWHLKDKDSLKFMIL